MFSRDGLLQHGRPSPTMVLLCCAIRVRFRVFGDLGSGEVPAMLRLRDMAGEACWWGGGNVRQMGMGQ